MSPESMLDHLIVTQEQKHERVIRPNVKAGGLSSIEARSSSPDSTGIQLARNKSLSGKHDLQCRHTSHERHHPH
jgi:hypothetical protein